MRGFKIAHATLARKIHEQQRLLFPSAASVLAVTSTPDGATFFLGLQGRQTELVRARELPVGLPVELHGGR
jgi:hypothetical protein